MSAEKAMSTMLGSPNAGTAPRKAQRIAGTGATAAGHTTALTTGAPATLLVGAASVRFMLTETNAGTTASTDILLPAYGRYDWVADTGTQFARLVAGDGSSAFEAWVWTSGPQV